MSSMTADYRSLTPHERVEAARQDQERLGPLAAERAKAYESLTLEQVMARWAAVMRRGGEWPSEDEFKIEAMAIFSLLGTKMGRRAESLRASGFESGEPVQ